MNTKSKESAVNLIDPPDEGDTKGRLQVSKPSELPAGEIPDEENLTMELEHHWPRSAEVGNPLSSLTTETGVSGKVKTKLDQHSLWNESYTNENAFEDTDKLGTTDEDTDPLSESVYPPYSDALSPPSSRYEDADKNRRNIILHAAEEEIDPNKGPDFTWVAVDLDGTILEPPREYEINGVHQFGEPLPGAKEALQELIDGGARVSIYTARQYFVKNKQDEENLRNAIENQLGIYDIPFTDVYIGGKPPAMLYLDDKNVAFNGDWDLALDTIRDRLKKTSDKTIDKIKVKEVPGEEIRKKEIEFIDGGHGYVYPDLIPKDEVWVEESTPTDEVATITHELVERELQKELGQSYDEAHEVANDVERVIRRKSNDPIKDVKDYKGIKVEIEWPKGSIRSYKGDDTYATLMKCDYGYAHGVDGNDGEELDVYLADGNDSDIAFIIEQLKEDGKYDEDKVMLGFNSEEDAVDMYLQHMPAYMLGDVRAVPIEKLVNALYGKPEDRRGKEDLIPKEEKEAKKKKYKKTESDYVGPQTSQVGDIGGVSSIADKENIMLQKKKATYATFATLALNKSEEIPELKEELSKYVDLTANNTMKQDILTRQLITNPDLVKFVEQYVGSFKEHRQSEGLAEEIEHAKTTKEKLEQRLKERQRLKNKSITTTAIIPERVGSKVWPSDPEDESENTDPDETRENRDIPRDPEKERLTIRNT